MVLANKQLREETVLDGPDSQVDLWALGDVIHLMSFIILMGPVSLIR